MPDPEPRLGADSDLPFRVNLEAVNKTVGLVAFLLPIALMAVWLLGGTCFGLDSISHYYYTRIGGDILVGALSVIGTLLLVFYHLPLDPVTRRGAVEGYQGHNIWDIRLCRFAGACAFGVAFLPTSGSGCEEYSSGIARVFLSGVSGAEVADVATLPVTGAPGYDFWATLGLGGTWLDMLHYLSALGMFLVLAYVSLVVFTRVQTADVARDRAATMKHRRNAVYVTCGWLILGAVGILASSMFYATTGTRALELWNLYNVTFWLEAVALWAFGVSWSVKGRLFNLLRDPAEVGA